jgi:NADPH-dependent 2,4-dienoyl-CoA reductase/sulfur reductase-like enzyme
MVRFSAEDFLEDEGYHLNEGVAIARLLEDAGADALDVTAAGTGGPGSRSLEPISYRQGWRSYLGHAIKKSVSIPVCAVSLAREPAYIERILESGQADFVGSGRIFLADPEYLKKVRGGAESDIRKCISCLRCIENIKNELSIVCSVNPCCGEEYRKADPVKDGEGRRVVVLGGGPAGLEAARIAGLRGFSVELHEKEAYPGGSMLLASRVPDKEKMRWFVEYQTGQCEKAGVRFVLNSDCTCEDIEKTQPYKLIIATGAEPVIPASIGGIDRDFVYTATDILKGRFLPRQAHVAVIGSGLTGLETAEYLAAHDNAVTIVEIADVIAPGANPSNVYDILPRLSLRNVVFLKKTELLSVREDRIILKNRIDSTRSELPVDYVVLSMGVRAKDRGSDSGLQSGTDAIYIGDASKAGRIMEAVRSGYNAAIAL